MEKSESINELATALAKAQGQIEGAKKSETNPFFKSKYADLASCWDACRKPLSDNSLSVSQLVSQEQDKQILETVLLHASGQWLSSTVVLSPKDDTPQAIGSAITYARRYALSAIVGIAAEDDDGESAQGRTFVTRPTPVTTTQAKEPASVKESTSPKAPDPLHEELSRLLKSAGKTIAEQAAWFKEKGKGKTWAMLSLQQQTDMVQEARQMVDLQKDVIR